MNLARDMKKEKRKAKEILVPLLNEGRHLLAYKIELMPYLRQSFRNPRTLTPEEKSGTRKTSLGAGITRQHLTDLDILKSMGLSWVALTGDGTRGQGHRLKPIKFLLNTIKLVFFLFFL